MQYWLKTIGQIALLRRGPQDLPASPLSLWLALLAYGAIVIVSGLLDRRPPSGVDLLVSVAVPLAATALLLWLRARPARFIQTAAALFGTGALIGLVNLPLWLSGSTPVPSLFVLLAVAGLFWGLAVDGHIWRNAIECSFAGGVAIAVVILFIQLFIFQALGSS
ncbi:MAG: hypothetical protein RQ741_10980 [Wenzhouxiangellaceae bacterium]|nr:hypothetical protein [Wenzhouxiangellaceae bacterium]